MTKKLSDAERLDRIEQHLGLTDTNTDPVTVEAEQEAAEKAKGKANATNEPAEAPRYGDANMADVNVPGDDAMKAESAPAEKTTAAKKA